jgi:hypothetical protein
MPEARARTAGEQAVLLEVGGVASRERVESETSMMRKEGVGRAVVRARRGRRVRRCILAVGNERRKIRKKECS